MQLRSSIAVGHRLQFWLDAQPGNLHNVAGTALKKTKRPKKKKKTALKYLMFLFLVNMKTLDKYKKENQVI